MHMTVRAATPTTTGTLGLVSMLEVSGFLAGVASRKPLRSRGRCFERRGFVHTSHMTRSLRLLLGALAVVALLAIGTGLALATGGHHASPAAPAASSHGDDGAENSTGDENEQEPADTGDSSSGDSGAATSATANHGAVVSKVARETPPGPDHGTIVSAVARDNPSATKSAANRGHSGS